MKKKRWRKMTTAPRDGQRILCTDGEEIQVCYPKLFPRPLSPNEDVETIKSMPGDV